MADQNRLKRKASGFEADENINNYNKSKKAVNKETTEAAIPTLDVDNSIHTMATETDLTNLLHLNDDCLIEICRLLSLIDLCAVAQTCIRLKTVASRVFISSHKELVLPYEGFKESYLIVKVFGNLVNSIIVNKNRFQFLHIIDEYCHDTLESLVLTDMAISNTVKPKISTVFSNLKNLKMTNCTINVQKEDKLKLFANCKKLVNLEITNFEGFGSNSLKHSFPELESLILRGIATPLHGHVLKHLISHKKLKKLILYECNDEFPPIEDNLENLEILSIYGKDPSIGIHNQPFYNVSNFAHNLNHLTKLLKLKKFRISCRNNSASVFINNTMSANSLEYLELIAAKMNDELLIGLEKLKKLRVLKLKHMDISSGQLKHLQRLPSLVQLSELTLGGNCEITDSILIDMVKNITNLKKLKFVNSEQILTQDLYSIIIEVCRKRHFKEKLMIIREHCVHQPVLLGDSNKEFVELCCYNEVPKFADYDDGDVDSDDVGDVDSDDDGAVDGDDDSEDDSDDDGDFDGDDDSDDDFDNGDIDKTDDND